MRLLIYMVGQKVSLSVVAITSSTVEIIFKRQRQFTPPVLFPVPGITRVRTLKVLIVYHIR